jgi:hypothetical protein
MQDSGLAPLEVLTELGPGAMAFWAFELIFFTPIGPIAAGTLITSMVACWLCRSGAISVRSPGMVLAGVRRPSKG